MEVLLQAGNLRVQCVFSLRSAATFPLRRQPHRLQLHAHSSRRLQPQTLRGSALVPLGLRLRDDSAERLLTAPGSVSLPRTHCRLRLLRLLVVKLALPLQLSHLGMHSDAHQNRAERAGLMFMLKEEIDKSVTQLLRPDPKLLKPKLTPPQRTRWLTQGEQRVESRLSGESTEQHVRWRTLPHTHTTVLVHG